MNGVDGRRLVTENSGQCAHPLETRIHSTHRHGRRPLEGSGLFRPTYRSQQDSGTGMDQETLDRIFEPFFTTKAAGKGTGLGLSQVYGFASQSGGDVKVESTPGEGTQIAITLPCASAPKSLSIRPEVSNLEIPSARILVVEDNEEVGAFAETLLDELGHSVTRASCAEDALAVIESEQFDLVFSDVVMPGIGGLRLAEELERSRPGLPVILATGYSQEVSEGRAGGRQVILKPYRLSVLRNALAEALGPAFEVASLD